MMFILIMKGNTQHTECTDHSEPLGLVFDMPFCMLAVWRLSVTWTTRVSFYISCNLIGQPEKKPLRNGNGSAARVRSRFLAERSIGLCSWPLLIQNTNDVIFPN